MEYAGWNIYAISIYVFTCMGFTFMIYMRSYSLVHLSKIYIYIL